MNDESVQLELLEVLLTELGLSAHSFLDVSTALAFMTGRDAPALIITDLHMPGVDGWRFCRLLRTPEYQHLNHVPVIVVSATFRGEASEEISLSLGAAGFIPAPIIPDVFLEQVTQVLNGGEVSIQQRVLVVEDDAEVAHAISTAFEEHGYLVEWANSGGDAQSRLREHNYDFAVIDHDLPDINGEELLKLLVNTNGQKRSHTVGIMMTSDSDPSLALRWLQNGAWGYLRKPIDPVYLIHVCQQGAREHALLQVEYRLEQRTLDVERLLSEKKLLLVELQHRMKNNMHTVATLLQLRSMSATSREAQNALIEAQGTVRSVLSIYETLQSSGELDTVSTKQHLDALLHHVLSAFAAQSRVTLDIGGDVAHLSSQTAVTLGIVLNELVTNSLKYAFAGERSGEIRVSLDRVDKGLIRVSYSDSGPGMSGSVLEPRDYGFGLSMVRDLSTAGGGSFTIPADPVTDALGGFSCTVVLLE